MTISNDTITAADQDSARTLIRAVLQEQDPTLDLSIGGPVDSLLVDGNVAVTARNDQDVDAVYAYQQLQQIAAGTVTVTDAVLDELMANYFLTRNTAQVATGEVVFVVQDNRVYSFPAGYRLRSNGEVYQIVQTATAYPFGTAGVEFDEYNVVIEQVYDVETGYSYRFVLPLSSIDAGADAIRVSGDRFTVDQGFQGLGYVQASTNFEGGIPAETNAQFATRGLQGMLARTVGGQDNIDVVVSDAVPLADQNSVGTGDPLMTRDRGNVFNIPVGGKIDTYVKVGAIAARGTVVDATVLNYTTRSARITLTRAQSAGVYRVGVVGVFTSAPPAGITGAIAVTSITHLPWTDPDGFNPETLSDTDRAFSARTLIQIDFTDTREVSAVPIVTMSSNGQVITNSYEAVTRYQPQVLVLDTAITTPGTRPPGLDPLVKAAVPCEVTVGLQVTKPADYNGLSATEIAARIASLINQIDVGTATLGAYELSGFLRSIDPALILTGVALTGTILGQDGSTIAVGMVAQAITVPEDLDAKVGPENTYFTTTSSAVSVSLS